MQRALPGPLPCREASAKSRVSRWGGGQAIEQRTQVESRSPHHDRKRPFRDAREQPTSPAREFARGKDFVRIEDIQHMMRNPAPLGLRQLGCPDVEIAVELE